jgi:hypothetical protein
MELIKNHRFGSSGLNLAFEELLLGVSLHTLVEGTRSDPRQSGFWIPNILDYVKEMLVVFYRKSKVSDASVRRLRWIDDAEACVTERAEARIRSWRTNQQPEVPVPTWHAASLYWLAKGDGLI